MIENERFHSLAQHCAAFVAEYFRSTSFFHPVHLQILNKTIPTVLMRKRHFGHLVL